MLDCLVFIIRRKHPQRLYMTAVTECLTNGWINPYASWLHAICSSCGFLHLQPWKKATGKSLSKSFSIKQAPVCRSWDANSVGARMLFQLRGLGGGKTIWVSHQSILAGKLPDLSAIRQSHRGRTTNVEADGVLRRNAITFSEWHPATCKGTNSPS